MPGLRVLRRLTPLEPSCVARSTSSGLAGLALPAHGPSCHPLGDVHDRVTIGRNQAIFARRFDGVGSGKGTERREGAGNLPTEPKTGQAIHVDPEPKA